MMCCKEKSYNTILPIPYNTLFFFLEMIFWIFFNVRYFQHFSQFTSESRNPLCLRKRQVSRWRDASFVFVVRVPQKQLADSHRFSPSQNLPFCPKWNHWQTQGLKHPQSKKKAFPSLGGRVSAVHNLDCNLLICWLISGCRQIGKLEAPENVKWGAPSAPNGAPSVAAFEAYESVIFINMKP